MLNTTEPNKQHYADLFEKRVEEARKAYIEENGSDDHFDVSRDVCHTLTAEEIVGYYLTYHEEEPYDAWMGNINGNRHPERDARVTVILSQLFQPSKEPNKQFCVDLFENYVEIARKAYIDEHGNDEGFHPSEEVSFRLSAEATVSETKRKEETRQPPLSNDRKRSHG